MDDRLREEPKHIRSLILTKSKQHYDRGHNPKRPRRSYEANKRALHQYLDPNGTNVAFHRFEGEEDVYGTVVEAVSTLLQSYIKQYGTGQLGAQGYRVETLMLPKHLCSFDEVANKLGNPGIPQLRIFIVWEPKGHYMLLYNRLSPQDHLPEWCLMDSIGRLREESDPQLRINNVWTGIDGRNRPCGFCHQAAMLTDGTLTSTCGAWVIYFVLRYMVPQVVAGSKKPPLHPTSIEPVQWSGLEMDLAHMPKKAKLIHNERILFKALKSKLTILQKNVYRGIMHSDH